MDNKVKLSIVASLVIAIGVVLALRRSNSSTNASVPYNQSSLQASRQASDSNFTPKQQPKPRLVDLGAGKCIACKMMEPVLEELTNDYAGSIKVEYIDVGQNMDKAREYGIRIIPTQIFFNPEGKELFRHEGFFSKEDILLKWQELGFKIEKKK